MSQITTYVFKDFDDPRISVKPWTRMLCQGDTNSVNLTWHWQRQWWQAFGKGTLLLIAAARDGKIIALAPLFADGEMVFNICPEDHLDFIGDISDPEVLDAILGTASANVANFVGFRFYFIPDTSRTGERLRAAAARLGLTHYDEGHLPCPFLDIVGKPAVARACISKKSLVRHERFFRREGELKVLHLRESRAILPYLDEYFEQHVSRRAVTPYPSLFLDSVQREYYRKLTQEIGPTGWLRFTRLEWNGRAIAHHFGLFYRGRYLYGVPSFALDLAQYSPGEVLLRQLLIAAIEEGAHTFDFGIGDETYKYRFATDVTHLRTWGLYPRANS